MTTDSPQRSPQGSARPLQQDRREFLKLAAAIPTALAATQARGADAPADKAKPADTTPMPQIQLGKYSISRLIVGCHNVDGGSHVSPFLDKEMHDYYTPERAVQTLRHCEEVGINTWQGHERGTLLMSSDRTPAGGFREQAERILAGATPDCSGRSGTGSVVVLRRGYWRKSHDITFDPYEKLLPRENLVHVGTDTELALDAEFHYPKYQVFLRFRKPSPK